MDFFYTNNNCESSNYDAKRSANEADFFDESGCSVPLPEELTKMFKPLECELCGVIVTSEVTAYTHYEGKVHMKNINAYMKEQYNIYGSMKKIKLEFTPHQCEVCKCDLSSLIQAQQHYSGKVHKKNLRKINYDPLSAVPLQPVKEDCLGPDLLKDLPPPPPPPILSDFVCEICNITTNTEYQLIVHKNGSKHQKKVKKLKESQSDCGTDGFGYYLGGISADNLGSDQQAYPVAEPIVTDYLPLSDEPLHFNNSYCNYSAQSDNLGIEENGQSGALCIKWFNDKTEAPPARPLEDMWVETFNRNIGNEHIATTHTQISQSCTTEINQNLTEQSSIGYKPPFNLNPLRLDSSIIRTHEASVDIAKLPQFSVAAVLPQLQAPPIPPITLITNAIVDNPISETEAAESIITLQQAAPIISNEPPKINFHVKSVAMSQLTIPNSIENSVLDNETSDLKRSITNSSLQSNKTDPSSIDIQTVKGPLSRVLSKENGENSQSSKSESLPKIFNKSEKKTNYGGNSGKFISDHWETSQETKSNNENNQKKKNSTNFLFAFKKELNKKKKEDTSKNLEEKKCMDALLIKETKQEPSQISIIEDKIVKKNETLPIEEYIVKDKTVSNKECEYALKEKIFELRKDMKSKRHLKETTEDSKYSKDKKHKKDRDKINTHDHHRSSDYHKKHRDYKKQKDDYQRHSDSDDDSYREEKKRHRHTTQEEKESHKSYDRKKPPLAQPFNHKSSTKQSIINYLAPPSDYNSKDIAMYRTPSGLYYCTFCDYKSKHSSEFTNHLYSRSHNDKKKKKTK